MVWRIDDPQGGEANKVKYDIVPYTRGNVLDLGCGPTKAFPHFVGVDNCIDTKLFGIEIKPDYPVADCSDLSDFETESCDAVFSSHLLEHIVDTEKALKEWWRVLKVGGYLVLYLPHRDLYPNVGTYGSNPDHKYDFTNEDIHDVMVRVALDAKTVWDLARNEKRDAGMEYSFLQVFQKSKGNNFTHSWQMQKPEKTACVVRYGGFGDQIQASNILPELKRQGYHVTFMTTPKGQDILRENPHIDAWFIQDENQVPNNELTAFWTSQAKRFDKFINLSESVEATLLALPGRANHAWPDSVRRKYLGVNYLEFTSELAELPYTSEAIFYPSPDEAIAADAYLGNLKNRLAGELLIGERAPERFNILWVLSGSSVHKFYPWQDHVIARIMTDMPQAVVIFNGDMACQILETGWENEPRVVCESGKMDIRQSLTLAQQVECVVGPETGVLNAVAFESNAKVILLSHSSKENLTKHWINADTIEPENTACYPCHRLHYGREHCHEHADTGAALCQANITPERVYAAIERQYNAWLEFRNLMRLA